MALHAHNIGPGDEVITPSLTWVSTIILISAFGATPVFVDVDRNNFMVTAETTEPLISERTRLIIPVHYAGAAIDITSIELIQCIKQIPIIEDAAHAMGTEYSQRPIGADGTAIFSILIIFIGVQLLALGMLGEYIGRIYNDVRARLRYFVREVVLHPSVGDYYSNSLTSVKTAASRLYVQRV